MVLGGVAAMVSEVVSVLSFSRLLIFPFPGILPRELVHNPPSLKGIFFAEIQQFILRFRNRFSLILAY